MEDKERTLNHEIVNLKGKDYVKASYTLERKHPEDDIVLTHEEGYELIPIDEAEAQFTGAKERLEMLKKQLPKKQLLSAEDQRVKKCMENIHKVNAYDQFLKKFGTKADEEIKQRQTNIEDAEKLKEFWQGIVTDVRKKVKKDGQEGYVG